MYLLQFFSYSAFWIDPNWNMVLIPGSSTVPACVTKASRAAAGTPSGATFHVWPTSAHAGQAPTNGNSFAPYYK
jgi:hypothetical protein